MTIKETIAVMVPMISSMTVTLLAIAFLNKLSLFYAVNFHQIIVITKIRNSYKI